MITVTTLQGIHKDNDYYYFDTSRASIAHADSGASFSMYLKPDELIAHIVPSNPIFKQEIIDNLLKLHHAMGIKIIFSKSLKISKTISYSIGI